MGGDGVEEEHGGGVEGRGGRLEVGEAGGEREGGGSIISKAGGGEGLSPLGGV